MNTEVKHTPGEWEWDVGDDDQRLLIFPKGGGRIIAVVDTKRPTHEVSWNAKLIAAAPELLEALQEVIKISDRKHDAWDKAKEVIKKATT